MAQTIETQLVVLGAGPGGYAAAFLAADRGIETTLIDARDRPGGVCLHCGCIPSKALLHAAKLITDAQEADDWGLKFLSPEIDIDKLRAKKQKIVDVMSNHLASVSKQKKINYIQTRGTFADSQTLSLENGDTVRFKNCILATGSQPAKIPTFDIGSDRVMDSTSILELKDIPESLLVIGGGYIGLEMGSVYAALGTKVSVVEFMDALLPVVDPDLVKPLQRRLKKNFEKIMLGTKVVKLEDVDNGVKATFEGAKVKETEVTYDRVLTAIGRRPNSKNIGLENTKVEVDEKGFVKVDKQRRTTDQNIFAIGDVAGEPMLAHKASHEGKLAVQVIAGDKGVEWDVRAIPAVVFTDPEIAWAGLMENEAKQEGREVKTAMFDWKASGRATTLGRTDGVTKLVVDPETDQVLGIGLCGQEAGEMIAEAVLAIEMGATSRDIGMSIHAHPTLSETVMEASESFHGMATHI